MAPTDKVDKREQILQVAERLFAEQGFDGTSVRDIAHQAQVNLAMISYYFGSKEKLLEALVEDRASYTLGILAEVNKNKDLTPWEKMEKVLDLYVEKIMKNMRFHCIMSQHYNTTRSVEVKELLTNIKVRNLEQIKRVIAEGQRLNVFRKVDMELTIASVLGTLTQVTSSRALYARLLKIDEDDDEVYTKKIMQRLKVHLKQMLSAHLTINNENNQTENQS